MPTATIVAGFSRWKKFVRFVKKGEKGIGIMAPLVGKKKADDQSAAGKKEDDKKVVFGFRVVHVFDVSQTEGEELPSLDLETTGDPGEKLEQLEALVASHGIELNYAAECELGGALGVSKGGQIVVLDSLEAGSRFSVLVHELAHELLHRGDRRSETTKTVRETEAEAVAYVVCKSLGLECGSKTADYIQLYSGDEKLLMQSLEFIRSTASSILSSLKSPEVEELEDAA